MSFRLKVHVGEMSCRWKVYVGEMSCRRNVHVGETSLSVKCLVGEMSWRWKVLVGEKSCRWNVLSMKSLCRWNIMSAKCPCRRNSVGEMSCRCKCCRWDVPDRLKSLCKITPEDARNSQQLFRVFFYQSILNLWAYKWTATFNLEMNLFAKKLTKAFLLKNIFAFSFDTK